MKAFALALLVSVASLPAADAADYSAYLTARFAAHQGDNLRAADEMAAALAADPGRADLQNQAFVFALLADRPDVLDQASRLSGETLSALVLADHEAKAGHWRDAELGYAVLPHNSLTDMLRPLLLAWSQAAQGQTDKALATLDEARQAPAHSDTLLLVTEALIADLGHRDGLADRLYKNISDSLADPDARIGLFLASWDARNGRDAQARAIVDRMIERTPDLAMAKPRLLESLTTPPVSTATQGIAESYSMIAGAAHSDRSSGQVSELLAHLALRIDPGAIAPSLLLAQIASSREQTAVAIVQLSTIGTDEPFYPVVQLHIASLKARAGDTAEATAMLEKLAKNYPNRPEPLVALGDIFSNQNKFANAIDAYSRAISRVPAPNASDWAIFYARGAAYERRHDWQHAQGDMQHALALSPEQPFVLNFLGFSMADRNTDLPAARGMIERALKQRPDDGAIIDSLGWVKLRQGDAHGALDDLEHASSLEPTDPTITGHLGDVYWQLGRHLEAENQWRRALVLNPDEDEQARIQTRLKEARTDSK